MSNIQPLPTDPTTDFTRYGEAIDISTSDAASAEYFKLNRDTSFVRFWFDVDQHVASQAPPWPQGANLQAALSDLDSAVDEAREEGFDTLPSDEVITSARRILQRMYEIHPCRFEVYPTQDGEITISAYAEHQRSVLVICDKDGGALCSVNLNGRHRRARYHSAATLPDGFVKEALAELL